LIRAAIPSDIREVGAEYPALPAHHVAARTVPLSTEKAFARRSISWFGATLH